MHDQATRTRGRPPLPVDEARTVRREVRLTEAEDRVLTEGAKARGMTVADYMRQRMGL